MEKKWKKRVAFWLAVITILTGMPAEYLYAAPVEEQEISEETAVQGNEYAEAATEMETEIETESAVDEQETISEQVVEAEDELLNYLIMDSSYIEIGGTQNVVADIGDGSESITDGKLFYHRITDGEVFVQEVAAVEKSGLRFTMDFLDAASVGVYTLDKITYVKKETEHEISLVDAGMNVQFGVNEEITTNPDAEVVDESTVDGSTEADLDVVRFDENGNQVSEDSIADAIEKQREEQEQAGILASRYNGDVVVVLDPGHDGSHGGTSGNGVAEAEVNLKIAQYCKKELEEYRGVKVYMTRDSMTCPYGGSTVGAPACNVRRVEYAKNVGANIYVSIHNNSAKTSSASGAEIYYPNTNYNPGISQEGGALASRILEQLTALGLKNRGTKVRTCEDKVPEYQYADGSQADYYAVIRNCKKDGIPAVIVEHAFITNASDVANFLSTDEKLQQLGIADATGIARYFGLSKNIDYSAVFDAHYYADHNADLKAAYGYDENKLLDHFIHYGMKEGRRANAEFDVISYRNLYPDLRVAYRNNLTDYYMHYIEFGKGEGRKALGASQLQNIITTYNGVDYSAVYDYTYYISKYPDLKKAFENDDAGLLEHFVNYGMSEGRQAKENFDVKSYRNAYVDLRRAFGSDLKQYYIHYIQFGSKEGRKAIGVTSLQNPNTVYAGVDYSSVYNYDYYIANNSDVVKVLGTDENVVLEHFVNYGMSEGRRGNESFDVKSYRNAYSDLRSAFGTDWKQYYMHYIQFGSKEGRKKINGITSIQNPITTYNGIDYSAVYDYNYYITANQDVVKTLGTDDNSIIKHFVDFGMAEGRHANEKFDVQVYKNNYIDLQREFGSDLRQYYIHYINYGKAEGRNAVTKEQQYHSIMGGNTTSIEQMVRYFNSKATYDSYYAGTDAPTVNDFCRIYEEESIAEGVNPAVAFCQAMKETGFLKYGGDVERTQNNFAGLGATGNGVKGNSFSSVREGIRAQIQHLKAYASTDALNNPVVDTRFQYVTRGCAPYVEWLGINENPSKKGWASATNYGYSIVNDYMNQLYKY